MQDRPTTVYRIYDGAGALLYVGVAATYLRRLSHHETSAAWFLDAASARLVHYPTRAEALAAEAAAIIQESPAHNVCQRARQGRGSGADQFEPAAVEALTRQYHEEKAAEQFEQAAIEALTQT